MDDDRDFREITAKVLSKEGYDVKSVSTGAQALEIMRAERPDLVLLDIMMADPLEGVAVSREMAIDPNLKRIPVIMVSSIESSEYDRLLPDEARIPIDAWQSKPVKWDDLLRTIHRFTG
ncbi:MAG: response regulator [Anaerolineae bacterium]|nr:response regulator [Anaerolineae bacterium]